MHRNRLYVWLSFALVLGYAWLIWNYYETLGSGPVVCFFRSVTGIHCPSCGTTTSIIYLLHGNFTGALTANPLGFLMILAVVIVPFWLVGDFIFKSDSFFRFYKAFENTLRRKWIAALVIAIFIVLWIINIYKHI